MCKDRSDVLSALTVIDEFISDCDVSEYSASLKDKHSFRNRIRDIASSLSKDGM